MKRILVFCITILLCTIPVWAEDTPINSGAQVYIEPTLSVTVSETFTIVNHPDDPTTTEVPQPSILESISNFIFGKNPIDIPLQESTPTESALVTKDTDGSMIVVMANDKIVSNVTNADFTNQTIPSIKRGNAVDLSGIGFTQSKIAVRIVSDDMVYIIRRG